MSLFNKKVGGEIAFYGLADWWETALSKEERDKIKEIYQPEGTEKNHLTDGNISNSSQSCLSFLSTLSTWFIKPETYEIVRKIFDKAEDYLNETESIETKHFFYQSQIKFYYRFRDIFDGFEKAVRACEKQIGLSEKVAKHFHDEWGAIPAHTGFKQLAIIREKQKDYEAVISICTHAKKDGWNGDWDKRIDKAKIKVK